MSYCNLISCVFIKFTLLLWKLCFFSDLSFKKGDIINLRKRIDTHWYHGECGGKEGVFPLTYVQVSTMNYSIFGFYSFFDEI